MIIGGIDVGTTGSKLTVYNTDGEFIYNVYREYNVSRAGGQHEVDAQMIFEAICELIKDAASKYELEAIGVTSFGETFALVDKNGEVLFPSMLYTDPRGTEEKDELVKALGEETIQNICGAKPHSMYSLPKLLWIKKNHPEIFAKAYKALLIEDFIVYKLTGVAQIDYSLAARTMAFDIRNKCWSKEILSACGIDENIFATPVNAGTKAGNITSDLKEKLGLKRDIMIVNGCHDQVAAATGCGIFTPGEAVDGTGTVECVTPVFDKIPDDKRLYDEGYSVVPYVIDGMYVCYALTFTGGATLKWYRDNFARFEHAEAKKNGKNVYAELDGMVSDNPTDLLILPHFAGAANPYMDNGSKAAILGLTLETTNLDIYKALMEGVAFEVEQNIEHLSNFGIKLNKMYATGGGANSRVWLHIKADVFACPVTILEVAEVGACGTCMLVSVAMGVHKDLIEAKKYFVKEKRDHIPKQQNVEIYRKKYEAFKEIYGSIRHIADKM